MTILELVSYKLKESASEEQLNETHIHVNEFLKSQPGFMYRSCSKDNQDIFHDIVYWQDMSTAKAASDAFMQNAAGQSLMQLCDETSITMHHMELLTEATNCEPAA